MNKVILMGRLTRDPEVRYTQGDNSLCIANFTVAVDRRMGRNNQDGGPTADFIPCVVFGKQAEHVEKYYRKGLISYEQLEEAGYTSITRAYSMQDAVEKARGLAVAGGNVLLSPACASFDMFKDYEERGRVFKQIVGELE